jgi:hypothetical protein
MGRQPAPMERQAGSSTKGSGLTIALRESVTRMQVQDFSAPQNLSAARAERRALPLLLAQNCDEVVGKH